MRVAESKENAQLPPSATATTANSQGWDNYGTGSQRFGGAHPYRCQSRFMHIHILGICGTFLGDLAALARRRT